MTTLLTCAGLVGFLLGAYTDMRVRYYGWDNVAAVCIGAAFGLVGGALFLMRDAAFW